ncbi:MAG: 30S ribosomal protein S8 [Candidatus Moranbacteria bacterium]|mgnify:CR=1 FL=1|jgi:small subunit ribosomal protein S8|nr:30S ribosomal protein S8 [Candidatus Moranbacteria bacterium]
MLDPIADMITRIRNAQAVGHKSVRIPLSKFKTKIAEVLLQEGFIEKVEKEGEGAQAVLVLGLRYTQVNPTKRVPAIQEITRVSTEGCRIYVKSNEVKKVKNGYGIAILSTSQGVMTGGKAYSKGLGGEYLCKVW